MLRHFHSLANTVAKMQLRIFFCCEALSKGERKLTHQKGAENTNTLGTEGVRSSGLGNKVFVQHRSSIQIV